MATVSTGRHQRVAAESLPRIAAGSLATKDLGSARAFYERFLGLHCIQYAPDRMLVIDRASSRAMQSGKPFFVIEARQVKAITHPQHFLNHWGLTVPSPAEVDRIHAEAKANRTYHCLSQVRPITNLHGAYGFYFADQDMNWWEIECRLHGRTNEMIFDEGDYDSPARVVAPHPPAAQPEAQGQYSSVVHEANLTHGTLETRNIERSRSTYENILGLRCVRHAPVGQLIAGGGGDVVIVCIQTGAGVHEQDSVNRWIVTTSNADQVRRSHAKASELRESARLQQLGDILEKDALLQFLMQDADGNWWDVSNLPSNHYTNIVTRGGP